MTEEEIEYLSEVIENEGLNYAFINYSSFENITNTEFHRLREAYVNAEERLEKFLIDNGVSI